jgi:hypothetical protein
MESLGRSQPLQAKILWIKNTLTCDVLLASEAYWAEASDRTDLSHQSKPIPVEFDSHGDLVPVF